MDATILAVHGDYRLVRHEPGGDARVEHLLSDRSSAWLTSKDVDAIRADPASMVTFINDAPADIAATKTKGSGEQNRRVERHAPRKNEAG